MSGCCWLVHLGDDELVIEMGTDGGMKKRWSSAEKEQRMAFFFFFQMLEQQRVFMFFLTGENTVICSAAEVEMP